MVYPFLALLALAMPALAQNNALRLHLTEEKSRAETLLRQEEQKLREYQQKRQEHSQSSSEDRAKLQALKELQQNRERIKNQTLQDIDKAMKDIPFFKKRLSRKWSLYKCIKRHLEDHGYVTVDRCRRFHAAKLDSQELERLASWESAIGLSPSQAGLQISALNRSIKMAEGKIKTLDAWIESSEKNIENNRSTIETSENSLEEYRLLDSKPQFKGCGPSLPEINLEAEVPYAGADFTGPFHGVPRDNQDGLGTCFANTAKNLLVGLSGGEINASFLDLALLYKKASNGLVSSGLDGGGSCPALTQVQRHGHCPQKFAPVETGERNHAFDGLMGDENSSMWGQARTISLLRSFLEGTEEFKKSNTALSGKVLNKAKLIIDRIKANPSIRLPLPVVRFPIHTHDWKLKEAYHLHKASIGVSEKEFLREYKASYKSFTPKYVKALMAGKNLDQIFELYKDHMSEVIKRYKLESALPEFKRVYLINAKSDFQSPGLQDSIRDTVDLLKELLGRSGDTEDFIAYCMNSFNEGLDFLGKLQPLLDKLKQMKVDPALLYDEEGKFRPAEELMQLAVAPACLNPSNREKIPFQIKCENGYDTVSQIKNSGQPYSKQVDMFRERVVLNLLQGRPLGNTFPMRSGHHINTIVGLRFNPETRSCEFLIRESQTGTSNWLPESRIFSKIQALTEVRIK